MLKYFGFDVNLKLDSKFRNISVRDLKPFSYFELSTDLKTFLRKTFILNAKDRKWVTKKEFFKLFYPITGNFPVQDLVQPDFLVFNINDT